MLTWICTVPELDGLVLILDEVIDVAQLVVHRVQVLMRDRCAEQDSEAQLCNLTIETRIMWNQEKNWPISFHRLSKMP